MIILRLKIRYKCIVYCVTQNDKGYFNPFALRIVKLYEFGPFKVKYMVKLNSKAKTFSFSSNQKPINYSKKCLIKCRISHWPQKYKCTFLSPFLLTSINFHK